MNTRALGGPTLGIETSFRSHFPTSVGKLSYDRLLLKIPSETQSFLARQPPSYSGNECPFNPRSEPTKARAVCSTTLWPWGNSALPSECWAPWAKTRTLRSQYLSETQPSPRAYQGFEYFFWRIPAVLRLTIHMSFPTELKSMEFWNQTNKRFQLRERLKSQEDIVYYHINIFLKPDMMEWFSVYSGGADDALWNHEKPY